MDNGKNKYDLTHLGFQLGKMGRVTNTMCLPVLPGDVVDINQQIVINMSPFRRQIFLDARVDVCTFYIPYRHHYSNWTDFIEDGVDTAETLSTTDLSAYNPKFLAHWTDLPTTKPDWYAHGYLDIWNRFYRPKASFADPGAGDATWASVGFGSGSLTADCLLYGFPAANLTNAIWNTSVNRTLEAADFDIDSSGATIDITAIAAQKARLKSERKRQFYSYYYEQIMQDMGGKTSIDAEPRPELVWQDTVYISGENIRGTDNQTIGSLVGRASGVVKHQIPRKYIQEHGTLWTMVVLRFPPISTQESHYLIRKGAGTYKTLVGDPDIVSQEKPVALQLADIFDSSSTTQISTIPYGQWYRMHPSYCNETFENNFGFTFAQGVPSNDVGENYYNTEIDDANFQSTMLGHYNMSIKNNVFVDRFYPSASQSIFAGSD